ncbi:hypothetical protein D3870_21120 [Noviherbaspirillum cavernae]|uniref:Uncharacterized protein n=1 Tax=Noviherbaspirillum cavernae TaxID=2320862 RepID=A0A418WW10_9BURK|nr:hypothetical protein D3870_21120 [Noviherbaspirillum cavernae]
MVGLFIELSEMERYHRVMPARIWILRCFRHDAGLDLSSACKIVRTGSDDILENSFKEAGTTLKAGATHEGTFDGATFNNSLGENHGNWRDSWQSG